MDGKPIGGNYLMSHYDANLNLFLDELQEEDIPKEPKPKKYKCKGCDAEYDTQEEANDCYQNHLKIHRQMWEAIR